MKYFYRNSPVFEGERIRPKFQIVQGVATDPLIIKLDDDKLYERVDTDLNGPSHQCSLCALRHTSYCAPLDTCSKGARLHIIIQMDNGLFVPWPRHQKPILQSHIYWVEYIPSPVYRIPVVEVEI